MLSLIPKARRVKYVKNINNIIQFKFLDIYGQQLIYKYYSHSVPWNFYIPIWIHGERVYKSSKFYQFESDRSIPHWHERTTNYRWKSSWLILGEPTQDTRDENDEDFLSHLFWQLLLKHIPIKVFYHHIYSFFISNVI